MKYGICHLSVIPCRLEPSDRSEQVNQLLFGETVKVYEKKKTWYRVKSSYDDYECWIDQYQFQFIAEKEYNSLIEKVPVVVTELIGLLRKKSDNSMMTVLCGSNLPHLHDNILKLADQEWIYEGEAQSISSPFQKSRLVENAFLLLNSPYQWGGKSAFGIDCSGFIQLIYKLNGIRLPRDASQQAKLGQTLSFIEEAEEGDLAFFDNDEGKITHVGMILKNNRIVHASGKVRIDRIDHQGIYNNELSDYSHRLRLITKIY
ncbi:MAG: hydrolase Nlp/P60 [Verrucomicrobia bacterium]|nr:hydrolase Nlp/P60 [Verrucomicrobiota bacterium]|tara:strand:+ start:1333 stop:2112 length:780 start_codon:yes stop_codon:yes gene_type:complete